MKTRILKAVLLFLSLSLFLSCDDDNNKYEEQCTDVFSSVSLSVKYTDETPVALDSYKVMWGDKNITPVTDFESEAYKLQQKSGMYAIITDNMKAELKDKTVIISVKGYIGSEEIFAEEYEVAADKCHVMYNGDKPLIITIEPQAIPFDIYSYIPMQVRYGYAAESREPLDSYKILWGDRDITPNIPTDSEAFKMFQEANSYPMINNNMRAEIEGQDAILTFVGYIAGKEVCSRNFTVSADENNVFYNDPKSPYVPIGFADEDSTVCTGYTAMVDVEVQYTDGSPVTDLKMEVMWGDKNIATEELNSIMYSNSESGRYAIISDRLKTEVYGKIITLEFIGYIDEKEVYRDKFKVSSDWCHVFSPDYKSLSITIEKP